MSVAAGRSPCYRLERCRGDIGPDFFCETVEWPDYDEDDEDLTLRETYPQEIWDDAQARWDNADDNYRAQHREYVEAKVETMMAELKSIVVEQGFLQSFTLWDLLWLGLAVASAWRIGTGTGGD